MVAIAPCHGSRHGQPSVIADVRFMKSSLHSIVCLFVGLLVGYGYFLTTSIGFQIDMLHQHNRSPDFRFWIQTLFLYGSIALSLIVPLWALFFLPIFISKNSFLQQWYTFIPLGIISGILISYIRFCALAPDSALAKAYSWRLFTGLLPSVGWSSFVMFFSGWLFLRLRAVNKNSAHL